ncbi:STAS domain-containing protein [uncultured Roseobacter sp.]|uniref:STAS domain-containing protein n=1 Tax=uncultured Roseobacter sp. TaxID=114847 RepID=UPI002636F259|nr:STAS domain-containing protein [uncultured Roseobacter sp.]
MSDPVKLQPRLDLSAAAALKSTLTDHKGDELVMDLSDVKHLGALCLQVMLAAAKSKVADGISVSVINASDRVIDQLRVMGVTPETISRGQP